MDPDRARRVVVVEGSPADCALWRELLEERYGERVSVETYSHPDQALARLGPDVHLLLLDLDVPGMSCREVFEAACGTGVDAKRIIVTSSQSAEKLHEECDETGPLAVIEKTEPEQHAACLMILDSIMKR